MADNERGRDAAGMSRTEIARIVGALLIVAFVIAFVVDNTRRVRVGFVFGDHNARLIYVFIVTFLLGVAFDRLLVWRRRHD